MYAIKSNQTEDVETELIDGMETHGIWREGKEGKSVNTYGWDGHRDREHHDTPPHYYHGRGEDERMLIFLL